MAKLVSCGVLHAVHAFRHWKSRCIALARVEIVLCFTDLTLYTTTRLSVPYSQGDGTGSLRTIIPLRVIFIVRPAI